MRISSATALTVLTALSLTGCDLLAKKEHAEAGAAAGADAGGASAKVAAKPQDGVHTIDGVGDVPAWSLDHGKPAKCTPSAAAVARFKAIEKGDDPGLVAGTADVSTFVKEVGADDCFASRKGLAESLNNGGYKRYGLKILY